MTHEDELYEAQQEKTMSTIDYNISYEQALADLSELLGKLGEDPEMFNLIEAVDVFYDEAGHADFHTMYNIDPEIILTAVEDNLKPEFQNL